VALKYVVINLFQQSFWYSSAAYKTTYLSQGIKYQDFVGISLD
jgi:hypothetical protein